MTTLVDDLAQRGLLDDVLVIAMGEFGRTPQMGTQGSTDGRNHWPYVHVDAAGRRRAAARPGDRQRRRRTAGRSRTRPVTPGDLAATIYRHFGVPLDATYLDATDRQHNLLPHGGEPIRELFG